MIEDCTLVYDIIQNRKRWVKNKYVQMYPKLYTPVWVNGVRVYR